MILTYNFENEYLGEDKDFDKVLEKKIPKNRLYALAGNSIVVDVLEAIFRELLSIIDFTHVARKVNYTYFGQQSLF